MASNNIGNAIIANSNTAAYNQLQEELKTEEGDISRLEYAETVSQDSLRDFHKQKGNKASELDLRMISEGTDMSPHTEYAIDNQKNTIIQNSSVVIDKTLDQHDLEELEDHIP